MELCFRHYFAPTPISSHPRQANVVLDLNNDQQDSFFKLAQVHGLYYCIDSVKLGNAFKGQI